MLVFVFDDDQLVEGDILRLIIEHRKVTWLTSWVTRYYFLLSLNQHQSLEANLHGCHVLVILFASRDEIALS